jgi:hypothetical protein
MSLNGIIARFGSSYTVTRVAAGSMCTVNFDLTGSRQ